MISDPEADRDAARAGKAGRVRGRTAEWRAVLRDSAVLVLVASLVVVVLRTHVADRYQVESASMEPTLHGDPVDGDEVLVARMPFGRPSGWPRVHDLVVVENRLDPDGPWLIKRLAARGPAEVRVRGGDLWIRTADRPVFRRQRKDPVRHAGQLRTSFEVDVADPGQLRPDPEVWQAAEGGLAVAGVPESRLTAERGIAAFDRRTAQRPPVQDIPGHVTTVRGQDSSFLDLLGRRLGQGFRVPRDLGLELEFTLAEGATAVHAVVEQLGTYYGVRLGVDGRGRFLEMGEPVGETFDHPALHVGTRRHRLLYMHLDGRFHVVLDGRPVAVRPVELPDRARRVLTLREPFDAPETNLLHIGFAATRELAVAARVHLLRAVFDPYLIADENQVWQLESDELFLLGDNVHDSADSRDLVGPAFRIDDLVGRPRAVLGPSTGWRSLDAPAGKEPER